MNDGDLPPSAPESDFCQRNQSILVNVLSTEVIATDRVVTNPFLEFPYHPANQYDIGIQVDRNRPPLFVDSKTHQKPFSFSSW